MPEFVTINFNKVEEALIWEVMHKWETHQMRCKPHVSRQMLNRRRVQKK